MSHTTIKKQISFIIPHLLRENMDMKYMILAVYSLCLNSYLTHGTSNISLISAPYGVTFAPQMIRVMSLTDDEASGPMDCHYFDNKTYYQTQHTILRPSELVDLYKRCTNVESANLQDVLHYASKRTVSHKSLSWEQILTIVISSLSILSGLMLIVIRSLMLYQERKNR